VRYLAERSQQLAAKVYVQPIEALAPAAAMPIALLGGFKEDLSKRHLGLAGQILQCRAGLEAVWGSAPSRQLRNPCRTSDIAS
jgi:hypothetical protein